MLITLVGLALSKPGIGVITGVLGFGSGRVHSGRKIKAVAAEIKSMETTVPADAEATVAKIKAML